MSNETFNYDTQYGNFSDQLIDNITQNFIKNFYEGHAYGEGVELVKCSNDKQIESLADSYLEILQDELKPFLVKSLIQAREELKNKGDSN